MPCPLLQYWRVLPILELAIPDRAWDSGTAWKVQLTLVSWHTQHDGNPRPEVSDHTDSNQKTTMHGLEHRMVRMPHATYDKLDSIARLGRSNVVFFMFINSPTSTSSSSSVCPRGQDRTEKTEGILRWYRSQQRGEHLNVPPESK